MALIHGLLAILDSRRFSSVKVILWTDLCTMGESKMVGVVEVYRLAGIVLSFRECESSSKGESKIRILQAACYSSCTTTSTISRALFFYSLLAELFANKCHCALFRIGSSSFTNFLYRSLYRRRDAQRSLHSCRRGPHKKTVEAPCRDKPAWPPS